MYLNYVHTRKPPTQGNSKNGKYSTTYLVIYCAVCNLLRTSTMHNIKLVFQKNQSLYHFVKAVCSATGFPKVSLFGVSNANVVLIYSLF